MNQDTTVFAGGWLWGSLWVFYAYVYGLYFGRVASSLKPDLDFVDIPGSPERLYAKRLWCFRFAGFMVIPTALEFIRSSLFTSVVISVLPCLFGLWVMHAVWREVYCSKVPKSQHVNHSRR